MKKIMRIYITDWINIFKAPVALLLIVGLMILPSLYAWINLLAMWDPYSNTAALKVAVVNEDAGGEIFNSEINKKLRVGEELVAHLKKNKQLNWVFVDKKTAEKGVYDGTFYASVFIPQNFSARIATIVEEAPKQANIIYQVNEKVNAIAPKITGKGATGIIEEMNKSVVRSTSLATLTAFNQIGIKLEKELPTLRHAENRIFELENYLPQIERAGHQALAFEKKLPSMEKKAAKVLELEKRLPEIIQAGQFILKLESKLESIDEIRTELLSLRSHMPEIQSAIKDIRQVKARIEPILSLMEGTIAKASLAEKSISAGWKALPNLEQLAEDSEAKGTQLLEYVDETNSAATAVHPLIKLNLSFIKQAANNGILLGAIAKTTDKQIKDKEAILYEIEKDANSASVSLQRIEQTLVMLSSEKSGELTQITEELSGVEETFIEQKKMATALLNETTIDQAEIDKLEHLSNAANQDITNMLQRYDEEIGNYMKQEIENLQKKAEKELGKLELLQKNMPSFYTDLPNAVNDLQQGQEKVSQLQQDFSEIAKLVDSQTEEIKEKLQYFIAEAETVMSFLEKDYPNVETKIHEAGDFIRKELPGVEIEIHQLADFVRHRLPELEEMVHKVANLVKTDLPELEDAVSTSANKIRQFHQKHNTKEIIALLKNDIKKESDFLAEPVELKEQKIFPIPNYGSGMSPFYTTLCLWVGGLLLVSLLRLDVEDPEGLYGSMHIYFGRLLLFMTIGFVQALIVALGDIYLLHAYVASPFYFILFSILISAVFMTIVYSLVSVFGNVGKALAICLLVVQLSGSGGTFPMQVTPPFFQSIYPFLPFTYAISILREAVGGMIPATVKEALFCLALFFFATLIFGSILKGPLHNIMTSFAKKAKESKIIH
ncbi:YhgE/Pip domain-containing protein [Niallia sp. NCCP-28]|uniref:YhgE/Pip domain-containing protein n=1 Tax=Niallia sp. NCCP-28 TaxID=2934712 RepID=UPI0020BE7942|nr:YhgE/Pip domain-containing protein [Niallia sp. NCCP-28]